MPTMISSEDYPNKRIYLHPDTVTSGFFPTLFHQEHRERRRLNVNGERNFRPMVTHDGNNSIGGGEFTQSQVDLRTGVRIVPEDTDHVLKVKGPILNVADGVSNSGCFDRLTTLSNVDIDKDYDPVIIREVTTGSGVEAQDILDIAAQVNTTLTPSFDAIPTEVWDHVLD